MNVYRQEMRLSLRSLTLWLCGALLFIGASAGKFAGMAGSASALDLFNGLPLPLQALFGIGILDFSKASGFYAMMYPYLVLLAAIHAVMLGAVILSKEERDKTSEFLYVKPAARTEILTAKALSALTQVTCFTLVNWAAGVGMVRAFGENADGPVSTLILGMLLVQLVFLSAGITAAAVMKHPKAAAGVAAGVMLSTYFLSVAIELDTKLEWLTVFSPFTYFDAKDVVGLGQGLNPLYALLCLGITVSLAAWAYLCFPRRDLQV